MKKIALCVCVAGLVIVVLAAVSGSVTAYGFQSCPPPPTGDPTCPPTGNGDTQPNCSPIILDLSGQGFSLTSAANGVMFDITGSGKLFQIAWTAPGAENGFLVYDRDGDGVIDSGKELFGNFTPQPPSAHPNGFAALAVYDQPANGGNGDGIIDAHDKIYSSLRIWIDSNHDGIAQPDELHTLPSVGVYSISLNYQLSMRRDQYGNLFRYWSKVNAHDANDTSNVGPIAYDVFLVTGTGK
ncbi:MAG: hypothetical protein ACRD50_13200 [Candidatus Acidiferrales bacterium]